MLIHIRIIKGLELRQKESCIRKIKYYQMENFKIIQLMLLIIRVKRDKEVK